MSIEVLFSLIIHVLFVVFWVRCIHESMILFIQVLIVDCWLCREIEDTILLALHSPEVYDDIARETRRKFESNRPRAVLFDGPPGMPFNPKIG